MNFPRHVYVQAAACLPASQGCAVMCLHMAGALMIPLPALRAAKAGRWRPTLHRTSLHVATRNDKHTPAYWLSNPCVMASVSAHALTECSVAPWATPWMAPTAMEATLVPCPLSSSVLVPTKKLPVTGAAQTGSSSAAAHKAVFAALLRTRPRCMASHAPKAGCACVAWARHMTCWQLCACQVQGELCSHDLQQQQAQGAPSPTRPTKS